MFSQNQGLELIKLQTPIYDLPPLPQSNLLLSYSFQATFIWKLLNHNWSFAFPIFFIFFPFRLTQSHNRMCSRKRRDSTMAALMCSIVFVFLCCHFCKLFLNLYEAVQMMQYGTIKHWPTWADNLTRWNHLMLVINSSSNIFIYVIKVKLCQLQWTKLDLNSSITGL